MKPLCSVCGDRHYGHQAHVFATNRATNTPVVATNDATNRKTRNRRDRGAYNAYQRVYMAVRRAVKAGRADWWPKRA